MPTRPDDRPPGAVVRGAAEQGLTLVEMLIVLAVVAVAAGATALSLGPRREDSAGAAARQLAAAIQAATDRSIATGARAVLTIDGGAYALDGARHALPPGVTLLGAAATLPVAVDDAPFALTVTDGRDPWCVSFDGLRAAATRGEGLRAVATRDRT